MRDPHHQRSVTEKVVCGSARSWVREYVEGVATAPPTLTVAWCERGAAKDPLAVSARKVAASTIESNDLRIT